jgi:hypothetical protein
VKECEFNAENMSNASPDPLRLIVASSRAPCLPVVLETVHTNVKVVQYKYETCTLDDILGKTAQSKDMSEVILHLLMAHSMTYWSKPNIDMIAT